jgi:Iap family predicted aminopeptidase
MPREKVAGKIVVFNERFDHHMVAAGFGLAAYGQAVAYREDGREAAARQGAAAVLVRSAGGAEFRLPHTGETGYNPKLPSIPAAAVTAEDAELMARLAAQGPVRLHLVLTPKLLPNVVSYNVVADLKGSEHPEQVVIVSGHLDSWDLGTGAIDDAAGVAVSMETAQLLKQLHLQPKRTIRIVAWMAEETGIFGGKAYAKQHANHVANHFAAIETDLGAGHPVGINVGGDETVLKLLQPVADVLSTSGAALLRSSDETGADIIPLKVAGVPTFSPIQDARTYFDYHHTAADTLDKIDPRELRENAAVVAVLAYALATMDAELPRQPQPVPDWLK